MGMVGEDFVLIHGYELELHIFLYLCYSIKVKGQIENKSQKPAAIVVMYLNFIICQQSLRNFACYICIACKDGQSIPLLNLKKKESLELSVQFDTAKNVQSCHLLPHIQWVFFA